MTRAKRTMGIAVAVIGFVVTGACLDAATPPARDASGQVPAAVVSRSAYVRTALADSPTALLQGLRDVTGRRGQPGAAVGGPQLTELPNGDPAYVFDGEGQYLRFRSRAAFQVRPGGVLTVEYWMRPDTLQFPEQENGGYVYVLGKGDPGQHEWYGRMYSQNTERSNRISGYTFNPRGGDGAGSYFQDRVAAGQWIHVALVFNARVSTRRFPLGYTKIYKDGRLRDMDSLAGYDIVPRPGSSPLRIGTGYLGSYFKGAVGDVVFYNRELTPARIRIHYRAM
jgi:Concanavalin A-like lectin/glucanases superfamily